MFCHGNKNALKKVSVDEAKRFLVLKCDVKGKFISQVTFKDVDPQSVQCKKRLKPVIRLKKSRKMCADVGADGRKKDLRRYIKTYQIGWDTEELFTKASFGTKFMELVSIAI